MAEEESSADKIPEHLSSGGAIGICLGVAFSSAAIVLQARGVELDSFRYAHAFLKASPEAFSASSMVAGALLGVEVADRRHQRRMEIGG